LTNVDKPVVVEEVVVVEVELVEEVDVVWRRGITAPAAEPVSS